ncbi:MAG: hypothetical protein H6721_12345 [Sandaracinus sp.]|nr:hypothetical protein [Sandaracinus sp.]
MSYGIRTAYRLVIEGLGLEAVTDPEMERLAPDNYRRRVRGLLREGLRIEEEADPAYATIEASGMTVSIVDRQVDEVWCQYLSGQPSRRTWLTADLDTTSTTITVASTTGFSVDEVLHVGTEACAIAAVGSSTQMTIQRGSLDTIAQAHFTADGDRLVLPVVTLAKPITLEGRRAYLYRYVDGDSLQGDGTLIGRFVCSTDARLEDDGATWTITLDPITTLLKQPIASDTDEPVSIRGAYYPPSYGRFRLHEMAAYLLVDTDRRAEIELAGHFETQENFCAALQAVIRTAMNPATADGTSVDITAFESTSYGYGYVRRAFNSASHTDRESVFVVPTDGGWQLVWTADVLNPAHLVLGMIGQASQMDGGLPGGVLGDILAADYVPDAGLPPPAATTYTATTLRGGMPRTTWGIPNRYGRGIRPDADLSPFDLFLSTTTSAFTGADVEWKDGGDPSGYGFGATADASLGRIRLDNEGTVTGVRHSFPSRDVEIKPRRLIATGTLADFRDGLVTLGPELANRGAMPFLTTEDLADWTTVVTEAAAGRPFTSRVYKTAGELDLEEMLSHECRLLGVFPTLDSNGKIALRHLRLPTGTSAGDFELGEDATLVDDQPPTWERSAIYGSINVVTIKTFYDVIAEEHTGPSYAINDVTAQSVRKAPRKLEIAPLSSERVRDARTWDYDLAVGVARRVLGLFGRPYSVVKVRVPYTLLSTALCGTVAVLTSPRIPDPTTGVRGTERKGGLVIGRSWDLASETGTLTLIVSDSPIAGYAPSAFMSSSASVSGNTYDVVVTFDDPSGASMAPAGSTLSDFYSVGDRLDLLIWDATTQSAQACTVDAIDDGTMTLRVTFDGAATLTGTRYFRFRPYDDGSLTDSQKRFAFFADASALLDDTVDTDPAREYSA